MAKQRANNLDAVTDGEFRCHMRHLNFLQNLGGITHVEAQSSGRCASKAACPRRNGCDLRQGSIPRKATRPRELRALEDHCGRLSNQGHVPIAPDCTLSGMREENHKPIKPYRDNKEVLYADIAQTDKMRCSLDMRATAATCSLTARAEANSARGKSAGLALPAESTSTRSPRAALPA